MIHVTPHCKHYVPQPNIFQTNLEILWLNDKLHPEFKHGHISISQNDRIAYTKSNSLQHLALTSDNELFTTYNLRMS